MTKVLIATRNRHKADEIQVLLGPEFDCQTLSGIEGTPIVIEDADSFHGNALKKAMTIAGWIREIGSHRADFVLADDSGLEVDALGGAPGVHSARFAALDGSGPGNAPDDENNAKLLRLLQHSPPERRAARFRCVIVLAEVVEAGRRWTFEGSCEGRIGLKASGSGGFGYDPLFLPAGYEISFGALGEEVKNKISHRARALAALKTGWQSGLK